MGRTYIPNNPTWVCDILYNEADSATIFVCADTKEQAGDAAIIQAIKDGIHGNLIRECVVYEAIADGNHAKHSAYFDPNKHILKERAHNLTVVK